jgi:tetratricopeptide (TPR) repeat protein
MPGLRLVPLAALLLAFGAASARGADGTCCRDLLDHDAYLPAPAALAPLLASCGTAQCAHVARGVSLLAANRLAEARAEFEQARALDPASPYPPYYLGEIALRSGDTTAAIDALAEAVRLRPAFAGAHARLGCAHLAAGSTEKGLFALRAAIAHAPGRVEGHLDLGRAYLDAGQHERAVIELERVLELDPQRHEARYLLARAQMNAGRLDEGYAALEAYVREARAVPEENDRVTRAEEILRRFNGTSGTS